MVESAGTGGYLNIPAAPNTVEVMREEGMDVSVHRGKCITPSLLRKADFIFIMERGHRGIILNMLPTLDSKIRFLKRDGEVPDPIGKPIEEYRRIRNIIKEEVQNIFLELFKKKKDR